MQSPYQHIYPGALHLHSVHSDGTGTIPEIARAARQAGLRWIIITDHNTLAGRPEQGWYGDLLVLVECEVTPPRNHFLAMELDELVDHTQPPRQFIDAIYAAGGWGAIAHPDERTDNALKQPYNWTDWNVDGPTVRSGKPVGIELWNWMSDWAEQIKPRTKYISFFLPRLFVRGPTAATLAWWDRLNVAGKRTFGTGNLDSHATYVRGLGRVWEMFPYLYLFRTITNYLWLKGPLAQDFDTARRQVLDALGAGHLWFANRHWGDARDVVFYGEVDGQCVCVGDSTALHRGDNGSPIIFRAAGPRSDMRLLCNGHTIARGRGQLTLATNQPGVYRIEARRWRQPWLYSNPIFVETT
ncbi:MAG: CehA/McbA family metallohydrolase [Chloroflexota bacterium]|nr:CehA/McbA family metallohydrolase [Chloroflexota bacterium]